jgi:hypothetical protein
MDKNQDDIILAEGDLGKAIETLLKVTEGKDHRLSDMADNKAQLLITVNSIILSAIISLILGRLKDSHYLAMPSFILLLTSLMTLILAILATRPSLSRGRFTASDLERKKVNLLFFGSFYRMKLSEYGIGMSQLLGSQEFLYRSLIKDEYVQAIVLGRKYRLLRAAYNVFLFGLILVVITFFIALIKNSKLLFQK